MSKHPTTSMDIAIDYIGRNWNPIPVPHRGKKPTNDDWQQFVITVDNVEQFFNGAQQNIGIQLGPKSMGLTDVDLDCLEAVQLAPYFLPRTKSVFGRTGKPKSHYLFYIKDPLPKANQKLNDVEGGAIIEIRMGGGGKGAQSIFPGSTHTSGEPIDWEEDGEPAVSDFATLDAAVRKIAAATILIRAWPAKGSRHDAALTLGGFLARVGLDSNNIGHFVEVVAREGGSDDPGGRAKDAVDSAATHADGKNVYGLPQMKELFGDKVAVAVAKTFKYREESVWKGGGEINLNWRDKGRGGRPLLTMPNARMAITALGIECSYDTFHNRLRFGFKGDKVRHEIQSILGDVTDNGIISLRQLIADRFGIDMEKSATRDAVTSLALEHCFDPICDMLDKAEADWDGEERLDRMAVVYFNCQDTPLNRAMIRKLMIAAVRRARKPGCKFDIIVVLESPEGWNKSTAWERLAGDDNFSDETIIGRHTKEVQEQLAEVWFHENSELSGMKKAEVNSVKSFASRTTDIARGAYGYFVKKQKRHSVEVGTTNDDEYLQSQTGNRRFWPLRVLSSIDIAKLERDRLQLWGEAARLESAGESLVLDEKLWPAAAEAEERRTKDLWEDIEIPEFLNGNHQLIFTEDGEERVSSADILKHLFEIEVKDQHAGHATRLKTVMTKAAWNRSSNKIQINGKPARGYYRSKAKAT